MTGLKKGFVMIASMEVMAKEMGTVLLEIEDKAEKF